MEFKSGLKIIWEKKLYKGVCTQEARKGLRW
jgi:hypothetical protein